MNERISKQGPTTSSSNIALVNLCKTVYQVVCYSRCSRFRIEKGRSLSLPFQNREREERTTYWDIIREFCSVVMSNSSTSNRFASALKKTRTMGRDEQEDFKKSIRSGAPYYKYKWSFNHILYFFNMIRRPMDPSEDVMCHCSKRLKNIKKAD
jgi:hypothetical protein